ncbi:uncharacterized oxidoreductase SSP0419 [Condylostylus longicornis]|uniref:uncharacterized oxidoreductase SSP0419 n=1 Tax=Condylostylus longicornis TaxID=2530218 RepID=UPI00244E0DE2|nr:uncharacterized oxidoreductase SSP0419 [Condylostylus longicornis]
MDPQTALVLAIQLIALFSIAGALLLYLLCKVRSTQTRISGPQNGTILITSVDTALGLQLATHLANRGCRVFAGMKDAIDSLPAKLLKNWMKMRESSEVPIQGSIVPMQLDVTREDILREAVDAMGAHMNASERGITAVINTAGTLFRGRVENQDVQQWETMLKTNILGSLRVAKAFIGLLKPTRGRLIYLGAGNRGDGLVAFTASKVAVESCADELRKELQPYGVSVVKLDTNGVPAESLYRAPIPYNISPDCDGAPTQYSAEVLTASALQVIEHALFDLRPHERYELAVPNSKFHLTLPCRSSFRFKTDIAGVQKV